VAETPKGAEARASADGAGGLAGESDLRKLLEDYERSLIFAALGAVGGRQRSAAALLRILPTTLNEKMKRLGIRPHRAHKRGPGEAQDVCASLTWRGVVPPGGGLELRGLNGPVRVELGESDEIEVFATRRGERAVLSAVEVKIVEHARGVTVCAVCQGPDAALPRRVDRRLSRLMAGVRVELVARVPPGVPVVATTVNDDIEVVGLSTNVDVSTANGHVRFLGAPAARRRIEPLGPGAGELGPQPLA
jgi:regulatory Fis family protein